MNIPSFLTATLLYMLGTLPEPQYMEADSFTLPVVMYHSVQESPQDDPYQWDNPYVVSVEQMEDDLRYLLDEGYEAIFFEELIEYVYGEGNLPEKPILLTFDDGYEDNYTYLYPLLKEYHTKAVIFLIGERIRNPVEKLLLPYLNEGDLVEMESSGLVEFQCHTYNFHSPVGREWSLRNEGESLATYRRLFYMDLQINRDTFALFNLKPATTFSYPGGQMDEDNSAIVEEEFLASVVTWSSRINVITRGDSDCLYNLMRHNRNQALTTEEFFEKVLG